MPSKRVLAAAVAFPAAVAQDAGSLVLLQNHAEWDIGKVRNWFNGLKARTTNENGRCEHWCANATNPNASHAEHEARADVYLWSMKCGWERCRGCAECKDSVLAAANATNATENSTTASENGTNASEPGSLSLAQGAVEVDLGIGAIVPVTEFGYRKVADTKDDAEMKKYIRRVAHSEARYVKDDGALNGLVPYYSGTVSVQSLDALRKELRQAEWVLPTEGRRAPLTEYGYQKIASMMSKPDMVAFARRILDMEHKLVTDEPAFLELISHFNGETGRNLDYLRKALTGAPWVHNYAAPTQAPPEPELIQSEQSVLNEKGAGEAIGEAADHSRKGKGRKAFRKSKRGKGAPAEQ